MVRILLSAVALVLAARAARAQDIVPEFSKFEFARERVGHKVVADATLVNLTQAEIRDVTLTAIYFDSERELKRSAPGRIDSIPAGGSGKARLEALNLPNFSRYEVIVESGAQRWVYMGEDPGHPPMISRAGAARLTVLSAKDQRPAAFPGTGTVTIVVRNLGESAARAPTAVLTYRAKGGALVQRLHVRLPDTIAGDTTDTFEVTVPRVPEYTALDVLAACVAQEISSPADSQFETEVVAVRQCRIGRLSNGTVVVTGQIRNGLKKSLDKVTVTFQLGKKEVPLSTTSPVKPGGTWPFDFYIPDCPPLDGCSYGLDYTEAGPDSKPGTGEPQPLAKRTATRKGSEVDPAVAQRAKMTVEVRGVKWVEGSQFLAMKGGGDVVFLRLAIRDRASKPVHPTGRMSITLFDGAKSLASIARTIKDETWGVDTDDLAALKAPADALAYDPAAGELWVGLTRGDSRKLALKADVVVTIDGGGTWEWKGLDKTFEAAAKAPDRPEVKK
jgi:hypothetical protein